MSIEIVARPETTAAASYADLQSALNEFIARAEATAKTLERSDPCRAAALALGRRPATTFDDPAARAADVWPYVVRQLISLGYYCGLNDSCDLLRRYRPAVVRRAAKQLAMPRREGGEMPA